MVDFKKDIKEYYEHEIAIVRSLDLDELNKAMNALLEQYEKGGNIYVFGNGGSAATASHMVVDFNKGVSMGLEQRFRFQCLNDNIPTITAVANDISYDDIFYYQLENKVTKDDLLIAISGSGNSKNVIKAVKYGLEKGCKVIGITGYSGGELYKLSQYHMHVPDNDMQVAEDLHMGFDHMMMRVFCNYLHKAKE